MAEALLSTLAVVTARPTVRLGGEEHPTLSELIVLMEMTECEGGLSALELRVGNLASDTQGGADLAFDEDDRVRLGAEIAVYAGDENSPREIFRGTITGLESDFPEGGPPELTLLAEDALQLARMARRTVVHEDVSIADLASELASALALDPVVTGFTEPIGTQVQWNESDLAFLRRLLARYDGDLQVVGRELHVSPRSDVRRGEVELELYSQLRRARVLADLAHQATEVTVSGWDASQGSRVTGRATGASLGPGRGRSGADVLRDAIGPRVEHLGHPVAATAGEAQALADAAFDRRARRFVCVEGTAEGNPLIRVGAHVGLTGLGSRFDNTYYVVRACHRYDPTRGYQTDFEAECAFLG